MDRRQKIIRIVSGAVLTLATIATRWPIRSKTFFEFDSINFAVALFRFDPAQVTPQMPGYIVHVLLGRLCYAITGDLNLAFVLLSLLLSIGSVLFLWRAAAALRGERVAAMAAVIWLSTPLFWFHGAINAIYVEEAFYTSALLYLGIKWLRSTSPSWEVICFGIVFSLAIGARQTSLLFFLPATIYLMVKRRPSRRIWSAALLCFLALSAAWTLELFRESGGAMHYFELARSEQNYRTLSVLFGNPWRSQLDLIAKVLFYSFVVLLPAWFFVISIALFFAPRSTAFISNASRTREAKFVFLIAVVPFLFYVIVFFMKAGYLLNVLPGSILVCAVLLDQMAIWLAEQTKKRRPSLLTRRIITRNATVLTVIATALNVVWFLVPWPGTQQSLYDNEDTRNSFVHGAFNRYEHSGSGVLTLANRAFEYTNVSGIQAVDRLNGATLTTIDKNNGNDSGAVLLASWWYRWCYVLLPQVTTYDLELDPFHPGKLWVGRSLDMHRAFLSIENNPQDSIVEFLSSRPVLLLLRHDRPDFQDVARQVHLVRLPLPEYLDIYKILDSTFVLKWDDRTFVGHVHPGSKEPSR